MSSSETSIFQMSPGLKMALFIGLSGIGLILGGMISFSIAAVILNIRFNELQTVLLQPQNASIAQFANALASIIAFGSPSVVIAFFSKDKLATVLGFARIKNWNQIGLVILIALTGLFLSGALGDLTEKIPIPISLKNWATQMEDQYKKALYAMTQMKSVLDLLIAIIAVAVVPAIVEELFFRASLQKILMDWTGKPYVAIVVTAIIFSAFHFSYFGFLSRMSLGIILGIIYFYTKTIWLPMLMHFINNGIGITTLYFVRNNPEKMDAVIDGNLPYYWVVVALFVIIILCKKLKETSPHVQLEKSI
ncbi:MAG: type II CAAX endopeptidase family protein [Bacteroidetes bacterium]|nr:type II CAAX endopeptidase family protein [Bacteroidota bacterium]